MAASGHGPRLAWAQAGHAQRLYDAGEHSVQQIAALLGVLHSAVYDHLDTTNDRTARTTATTVVMTTAMTAVAGRVRHERHQRHGAASGS